MRDLNQEWFVFFCGVTVGIILMMFIHALVPPRSEDKYRLIGIGCDGAQGVLYAKDEDDFPLCDVIVTRDELEEL